jgi:hypothetical protein
VARNVSKEKCHSDLAKCILTSTECE